MLYLESTAVACYQASEEIGMSFASIFGATTRSNAFYAKYSDCIQVNELAAYFIKEHGLAPLISILEYSNVETNELIPLSTIWLCISSIPTTNSPEHNSFKESLFARLQRATVEDLSLIHICRCRRIERCRSRWSPYH
eukprot:TRINITY_DN16059_c0_g2_i1.p1 TRINITY_DN16059_c0_g2~~TRINITY_DN16059_c0_g2_i1.p1  ORF type:complete len:138 (-),score=21.31 TRINITY_DN16059_c0_g2_i1:18-431(-)